MDSLTPVFGEVRLFLKDQGISVFLFVLHHLIIADQPRHDENNGYVRKQKNACPGLLTGSGSGVDRGKPFVALAQKQ